MSDQQDLFGGLHAPERPKPARRHIPLHEMSIGRFKLENGMVAWKTQADEDPWVAYKAPPGHEGRGPVEVIAELADWLDQNGYMTYGDTQRKAVTALSDARGILVPIQLRED